MDCHVFERNVSIEQHGFQFLIFQSIGPSYTTPITFHLSITGPPLFPAIIGIFARVRLITGNTKTNN